MNNKPSLQQLQQQLAAAQETIKALSKRMRQVDSHASQLPFQKQLQSYQQRIAEKSTELEQVRNWSELIIQHSMDAIIRIDQQGSIQSWNPMAEQMFGYSAAEILGRLVEDILIPEHLRDSNVGNFRRHLQRGKVALVNKRIEGVIQCKNGSELPVEFVGSVVQQGDVMAYAMVFRDISGRKAAEQKLHDSHANLEALVAERTGEVRDLISILESTPNLVGMANLQGKVLYSNPAGRKTLGVTQQVPLADISIDRFHRSETNQRLREEILPQTLEYGVCETTCEFVDMQGREIPMACIFMRLTDQQGKPNRFALIARDLRQEIALQKQLEHGDRLESLGVLAGGIAHDFNNILTAIIGNTGLAKCKLDACSPAQENLKNIEQSSMQAANLCKQMLAYSGKGNFVIQAVNLSRLITEMYALLEISIDKKVVLRLDLCETLPPVDADITQIQQIVLNLVINASEAIEKSSGIITIATGIMAVDEQYLQQSLHKPGVSTGHFSYLEVSDSGCGMDAETRKKIFDPFFTTKFAGRGLGMSAVLGIVHAHQGLLNLYSESGKGTTFKIALPISTSDEVCPSKTAMGETARQPSGLILVIDDEESIREIASVVLEDMGFEVITAVDGKDGIDVFGKRQHSITGVLLDMTMPRMNGEDCYRELRKINPDIKVILSSGYSAEDATAHFQGKGLAGFIQKPYLIDDFRRLTAEYFSCSTEHET